MIRAEHITKKFGSFTALHGIDIHIEKGCIYGMVGSNGAGKSTLLRILTGVYRQDSGTVTCDGESIYDNPAVKRKLVFVPDELFFLPGATIDSMARIWRSAYPSFDGDRLYALLKPVGLEMGTPVKNFSKGMRRQAATMLALAARPDYVFFDETFDGLDPIVRNHIKQIIRADVTERGATAVITSHSLRELEDTCDQLALLHRGGVVLESDIEHCKTKHKKVQIGFREPFDEDRFDGISYAKYSRFGSVATMILSDHTEEAVEKLRAMDPVLLDILPLTLEEMFTYELEALGYRPDQEM